MTIALELCIRLGAAGVLGAIIGYERDLRGKVAGVRTHFLVALGACLFMIISLYGFEGAARFDAARVAAGVVGGLGFLGGGIIMKNKHVSGLTTATGIWVTGAIGLAMGGGLYELAVLCAILMFLCMEALHFYTFKYGERQVDVVLTADSQKAVEEVVQALGKQVNHCAWSRQGDRVKAELSLLVKKRNYPVGLMKQMDGFSGIQVESID
jgi:putative Mg2+ transporter-C (MgtC) family protein